MKILKKTVTRKVIACFNNLSERRKLLKVAAFVIFPTSMTVLFENHQRFKDHFLSALCTSFNYCKRRKTFAQC